MARGALFLVACLLAASLGLAGCAEDAPDEHGKEIVVLSDDQTQGAVESTRQAPMLRGHIQGVVVDQAIRPIPNATVSIPGINLTVPMGPGGEFTIADLEPSSYMLHANSTLHHGAHVFVEVPAGELVKVRFVLTELPSKDPAYVTQRFDGFTDLSADDQGTQFLLFGEALQCSGCTWDIELDPTASAYLLEATMDPNPAGSNGFEVSMYTKEGFDVAFDEHADNPYWRVLAPADFAPETYVLAVSPISTPPEPEKPFTVYLTTFYNQPVPGTFSALHGAA